MKVRSTSVYARKPTGNFKPCPGEAHSNAFIDNCMVCLHHKWGLVPVLAPVDLKDARKRRKWVAVADLPPGTFEAALNTGKLDGHPVETAMIDVRKPYGRCSFFAVRFVG